MSTSHHFHGGLIVFQVAPSEDNSPSIVAWRFPLHLGSPRRCVAPLVGICSDTPDILVDKRRCLIGHFLEILSEYLFMKFTGYQQSWIRGIVIYIRHRHVHTHTSGQRVMMQNKYEPERL